MNNMARLSYYKDYMDEIKVLAESAQILLEIPEEKDFVRKILNSIVYYCKLDIDEVPFNPLNSPVSMEDLLQEYLKCFPFLNGNEDDSNKTPAQEILEKPNYSNISE